MVMVFVAILIIYSLVMTTHSLSNSYSVKQSVYHMSALYIAESGLDAFLARIQANRVDAIKIPLHSGPGLYPGNGYPGIGENWNRITLNGIHYFVSSIFHIPKDIATPDDIVLTVLNDPDRIETLFHAEDGTGISAADDRKLYENSVGSFFLRIAYFRRDLEDQDFDGNREEFLSWGGDNPVPNPLDATFFNSFYIQISSIVHLHPRSSEPVEQIESILDINQDGLYNFAAGDRLIDTDGNGLRTLATYRKISYDTLRIVEGVLQPQTTPDVTEFVKGAIINVGTSSLSGDPKISADGSDILFENANAATFIKGDLLSNRNIKVGSSVLDTGSQFSISLKKAAVFLDMKGFSIFKYGWKPSLLATESAEGIAISWQDLHIVNPLDRTVLYQYPYSKVDENWFDSSNSQKTLAKTYSNLVRSNLAGTPEEIQSEMVQAGSSSQLFDFDQYTAVAAATRVKKADGSILEVPGVYYNKLGNTVSSGMSARTATGDIDWYSAEVLASQIVAFHGPAGWVFKDIPSFAKMLSKTGALHGVVIVNIPTAMDISDASNIGTNGGLKCSTSSGLDFPGNPTGTLRIQGTLVFRCTPSITPNTKIKIQTSLFINPAEFPVYPLNYGDEEQASAGDVLEAEKIALRGSLIPPNDPIFFNSNGEAPSGYPETQAKRESFYDQAHATPGFSKTVFPAEVDISLYNNPNGAPGSKFNNLGESASLPDYPALMFNQSVIDIHGTANVCGVVFGPASGEIENKGETASGDNGLLYQYFVGALIVGNGIKIKNNATSVGIPPFSATNHWTASVFIYQPSCIDQLMISELIVPPGPPSWKLQTIYIGK